MYNKETHLSEHFTKIEAIESPTAKKYGIKNDPSKEQWARIQKLVDNILEPLRIEINAEIKVNSIFRSQKLNERVKGSGTSQHLANNGAAADIECPSLGNQHLFDLIKSKYNFDQLIFEYGSKVDGPDWVHVSYVSEDKNRHEILQCIKDSKGNPKYIPYKY